ncbi:TMhelix containing protein [Vibrio phage 2.275.O._10N.286.54.E11]|nr:TMhelix containing protein [Vibrio phage 2.275.O._10N.286.54.E11]
MWVFDQIVNEIFLSIFVIVFFVVTIWMLCLSTTYVTTGPDKPGESYYEERRAKNSGKLQELDPLEIQGIGGNAQVEHLPESQEYPPIPPVKDPKTADTKVELTINFR